MINSYDAWNRLVKVKDDVSTVATYTYDALNRRVKKTVNGETRHYYYNRSWQCVEEFVGTTRVARYLWGLRYIDDLMEFAVGNYTLALTDANYNVVAVTTQSGVTERYTYNAFGQRNVYDASFNVRSASNHPHFTRTFTGQVLDAETGMMLYRNRHYHPALGRFIQRDPIGYEAGDINLYRYVGNQCIRMLDPLGWEYSGIWMDDGTGGGKVIPQIRPPYQELESKVTGCCKTVTPLMVGVGWTENKPSPQRKTFLENLVGSDKLDVLMADNVNDMLEKINNHVKECQCIQNLTINSHGAVGGGFRMTGYVDGGKTPITPDDLVSGWQKGKQFGEAIKGVMCDECTINIMSCSSAEGHTIKQMALATGCKVRGTIGGFTGQPPGFPDANRRTSWWITKGGVVECSPLGQCSQWWAKSGNYMW